MIFTDRVACCMMKSWIAGSREGMHVYPQLDDGPYLLACWATILKTILMFHSSPFQWFRSFCSKISISSMWLLR